MTEPLNFQSIILTLQHFWADQGCLIWQPYYSQVGAGTMNPATFLRVLGPEPWKVAYVEPSIRPDDGRYGENPNRMQMHYQFQVILKPDPGNPQEIYLRSLEALGIDLLQHDIRFVEDNWESPALGAWGLGWEVWLDGQEITQFTYFQQAGGFTLDPVSVEITYGLDRIAIALQHVGSFREIRWSPNLTAGEVNLQAEQEQSKYYFEIADVERLRQMYDLYEAEAKACLEQSLVLPAYDCLLRCSHTFNVLDSRGAVGVTDRQALFGRMRELSRHVAEAYLKQRQELEYPWMKELATGQPGIRDKESTEQALSFYGNPQIPGPDLPNPFLLEIGTEELPVGDLDSALEQLRGRLPTLLDELHLQHGEIRILGTPRRLVALVTGLAANQSGSEQVIKGPPADRAFNQDGTPTKAAEGFARSKGVSVSDLQIRPMDGGQYAVGVVRQAGRPAGIVLAEALPGLLATLRFEKPMRWNSSNVFFSRPIRWLLALFGEQVIPFEFAGVLSGNTTRGLRFKQPEQPVVRHPDEYLAVLSAQGILLNPAERQAEIWKQVHALAVQVDGEIADDPALLAEVTNLVEAPTALYGTFDPSHLKLPREVLISVMKKHQRYFPVQVSTPDKSKKAGNPPLQPHFIAVRNGDSLGLDVVVDGNEHVIRARFADANFFVREDIKQPLEAYLPRLATLTFQVKLGSMLDKTHRIEKLVDDLIPMVGLDEEEAAAARRVAVLCKADLATKMVVEMTSLQGMMGRYYAYNSGESELVSLAIFEHYLPRYPGDILPRTRPGLVVGLADRLDTLAGLFAVGLAPSGNKDPFAQRRAALGLVQTLITWELDFELGAAIEAAAAYLPVSVKNEDITLVIDFIAERLRNLLLEQGACFDVVDAVLAAQRGNPAHAARAVKDLTGWVARPDWNSILPAYARCVRITRDLKGRYPVNPQEFAEPAERDLYNALSGAEATGRLPGSAGDFLNAFLPMIPAINRFFNEVLVMAEEARLRENRLGLLQRIAALAEGVADMSKLEGF